MAATVFGSTDALPLFTQDWLGACWSVALVLVGATPPSVADVAPVIVDDNTEPVLSNLVDVDGSPRIVSLPAGSKVSSTGRLVSVLVGEDAPCGGTPSFPWGHTVYSPVAPPCPPPLPPASASQVGPLPP